MNKNIIIGILCGLLAAALIVILSFVGQHMHDKDIVKLYQDSLSACQHAPATTNITHGQVIIPAGDTIRPKPTHTSYVKPKPKPESKPDSVASSGDTTKPTLSYAWYDERYFKVIDKDTFGFKWSANVLGEIKWIVFDSLTFPKDTITITKTVPIKADCPKITNHYGIYIAVYAKDFEQMPGAEVGMFWSFKNKWGLRGGVDYNTMHSELYGKVGFDFYIK